jgi:hypothetical protein
MCLVASRAGPGGIMTLAAGAGLWLGAGYDVTKALIRPAASV